MAVLSFAGQRAHRRPADVTRRTDLSHRRPLPRGAWVLAAVVGAGVFAVRVWDIHRHFWMLGDQIRDWEIAL